MNEKQDKLDWLAFRYVANELEPSDVDAFESRLLTEQAAREAVARVVDETTLLHRSLSLPVVAGAELHRTRWNRKALRVAIVAAGSCLTLLPAICLTRSSILNSSRVVHGTNANDTAVQLAYAWAESRDAVGERQDAADAESLDAVLNAPIDSDLEQSLVAPSWMLAALARMDGGDSLDTELQE